MQYKYTSITSFMQYKYTSITSFMQYKYTSIISFMQYMFAVAVSGCWFWVVSVRRRVAAGGNTLTYFIYSHTFQSGGSEHLGRALLIPLRGRYVIDGRGEKKVLYVLFLDFAFSSYL